MEPAAVRSDIRTWPLPSLSVKIPATADSAGRHGSERLSALNYMALAVSVVLYFPDHSLLSPSQDQHGHSVPSTSAIDPLVLIIHADWSSAGVAR